MKAIIGMFCFALAATVLHAQDFAQYDNYTFKVKEDYKPVEPAILEMSNYVLTTKPSDTDKNQRIAFKFIILWMSGTPDHQFAIDASFQPFMEKNDKLLGVFMASMAKYFLSNPNESNAAQLKKGSYEIFLNYCGNDAYGIKKFKELNRALAAQQEGKLDTYLKL
ncbi:hypothetical protein [Pseudochryseolinea flava]|uniref:Uncharacterized protein n=1 Tax=Pseudochryseolinea flava TaxID=2059302 RepID=A0A364Y5W6_9BACT|nr:hypothetical protein [Pseudochryseolinea flava]RAW01625.1 hypothetical protein DQQ10_08185 [Pseudochryseolinea flava]